VHQLVSIVLWGGDELALAEQVVAASDGAATRAPQTSLGDLLALSQRASLMVSGDTGPVHIAAAMRTPIVGLYGPTWPERNGPWDPRDVVVSRAGTCECHHKRRCQRAGTMCIDEIGVEEVTAAVSHRLASAREAHA
jgi:ADP-heptose:LPS heptosyltransferase